MLVLGWVTAEEQMVLLATAGRFASPVIPCVWEALLLVTWWSLLVITTACWEVASPVILRLGGKGHVAECDSEGVCTHLGASLVKVNKNQKALPNLPIHWVGRVAARNINCLADF